MSHHDKFFFFPKIFLCIDTDTAPKLTIILEVLKLSCVAFFSLFSYLGAMWVVSKTIPF